MVGHGIWTYELCFNEEECGTATCYEVEVNELRPSKLMGTACLGFRDDDLN